MSKPIKAWHFVAKDKRLGYGDNRLVETGKTYSVDNPEGIELCRYGMHASLCALDALDYAPGPIICRVELSGRIIHGDDKLVAEHRKVLWMADASKSLYKFACNEAYATLWVTQCKDQQLWDAIQAKHDWLNGKISSRELSAAAKCAALSAACSATHSAAYYAYAARSATGSTAHSAACSAQREMLNAIMMDHAPEGYIE